jgi:AcrR family transcriptional regulator
MDAIAAASKSSKATLYRQWQDKPTLVVTAIAELSDVRMDTIDTGSLRGDLEALMRTLASRADQNTPLAVALVHAARRDAQLRAVLDRFLIPQLPLLDVIAERAAARGELKKASQLRYLPELLIGVLFTPMMLGRGDAADEQSLMAFLDAVIIPAIGLPSRR